LGPFSDTERKLARRLHSPCGRAEHLPTVLTLTIMMEGWRTRLWDILGVVLVLYVVYRWIVP
jgi:hypothetical protein